MEGEQRKTNSDENVKLAQLYKALTRGVSEKHMKRIIDQQSDLNLIISENSIFKKHMPALVGGTLLHFAYADSNNEAFEYLRDKGIDYTNKNTKGSTALHEPFEDSLTQFQESDTYSMNNWYVDRILEAHLRDENFANPRNARGISHLHAACAANEARAVELFLRNVESLNQSVNAESPIFPGYTPLHFAVRCGSVEATEVLLRYNANSRIKDATGATPLHVLVRKQLSLIDGRNKSDDDDDEKIREKIERNERMMMSMLKIDETFENVIIDDSGLSTFHVACTMLDKSLAERLLANISDVDRTVDADSPFWPGYTALHFAALCNVDTVKLLLNNGANVEAKSKDGTSVFDMCLERYELNDISYIISCHPIWKDIQFLDSQIKLVNFIEALYNTSKLIFMARNFLLTAQSSLPLDSPLWPGSTPLHLAVILFERDKAKFHTKETKNDDDEGVYEAEDEATVKVIKLFFNEKYFEPTANVLAQDAYGRTSIHLAYRAKKCYTWELLFEQNDKTENPIDIDNVSLLHLACLLERNELIEELLFIGEDVNMPILTKIESDRQGRMFNAGSTPLHIAVLSGDHRAMKKLLTSGADPFAQDVDGITPIHQVIASGSQRHCETFVSSSDLLNVAVTGGVTYLHVACIANDREAVKKLIELGVDINATIELSPDCYSSKLKELLTPHVGSTPLHFALQYDCISVVESLISREADLFASELDGQMPIVQILNKKYTQYANVLLLNLRYDEAMRKHLLEKTGLTLLHVACNALDVTLVKHLLENGAEVNAQALLGSPVWPGCTSLHVLLKNLKDRLDVHGKTRNCHVDNVHVVLKLLLNHGADVTLMNADKETSIDISMELYRSYIRAKTWLCTMLPLSNNDYYDLNFVDIDGITLFQEACHQSDISVVQEFLKRGVDVNQRVDVFSSEFAGYTPLHFAAKQRWRSMVGSSRHMTTIQLLLDHGADVHLRDVEDNTPLHTVVQEGSSREELISKLIKFGADLSALNIYGRTPFEVLLRSSDVSDAEVAVFLQNGARINSYNCVTGSGYIPLIFESYDIEFDKVVTAMIDNTPDLTDVDEEGRTIIHNIVSCTSRIDDPPGGLSSLCARFIERGCDIDQQDKSGKTALHTAVKWQNENAVLHLLIMNANVGIVDNDGKTALDYATESCTCDEPCEDSDHVRYLFALQAFKYELTGFQEFTNYKDLRKISIDRDLTQNFRKVMKKAKKTYVVPGELMLYDFALETGAVSSYLHMPILKRNAIDEFFRSMNNGHFGKVAFWLRNHYGKAVARSALVESAKQSLNGLIGFSLPHLCSDGIFRFLSNVELKNLIAATAEDLDCA